MAIDPGTLSDIFSLFREIPLSPYLFAAEYLKRRPKCEYSKKQIADVIKQAKQVAVHKETRPLKGQPERFSHYELKRGALVFGDSIYFRRHYIGGPWFALLIVDAYSKATYLEPVKKLTAKSVAKAFERIVLRFFQGPIKALLTDQGKEYIGEAFQNLCKQYGIEHRTTTAAFLNKSWLSENRIRFVRRILGRLRSAGAGSRIQTLLQKTEHTINFVHPNALTGLTPQQTTNQQAGKILEKLTTRRAQIRDIIPKERMLQIGDSVLLRLPKTPFDKTDDPKFSEEIFTIAGVKPTSPRHSYRLHDAEGNLMTGSFPYSRLAIVQQPMKGPTLQTESVPFDRSAALFSRLN